MHWFIFLVLLPLAGSMALYTLRWQEEKNTKQIPGIRLTGWKVICCTVQGWLSFIVIYGMYALRLPMHCPAVPAGNHPLSPGKRPPLLLVHPILHNSTAWLVYRLFFRASGYNTIYFFEYAAWREDFSAVSRRLTATLQRLVSAHPGERPIIIGASMGGVLARSAVQNLTEADARQLGGCITIACPHGGSRLADFAPTFGPVLLPSLRPEGKAIRYINEQQWPPSVPGIAFFSLYDELVLPPKNLLPPPGWQRIETAPSSHIHILLHISTARQVAAALNSLGASPLPTVSS